MTVEPNQSLLDVILQGCGSMEAGMQVALDNGMPLSYMPVVGSDVAISIAAKSLGDAGTLLYLTQNGIVIGTKGVPDAQRVLITEDGTQNIIAEDGSDIGAEDD